MVGHSRKRRPALGVVASAVLGFGVLAATAGSAAALGVIFNRADPATSVVTVHAGSTAVPVASYQIDTTNNFSIGDVIVLKIEGVADPTTTNAAIGFASTPTVAVSGPDIGAYGAGAAGNTTSDHPPTFTTTLASSAGAASIVGAKDELVITLNNSSAGTATDHYTFEVSGISLNIGSAVIAGSIELHAYTGDGTGSLAVPVVVANVSNAAVDRLAGADRIATAIAISGAEFPNTLSADAVVLARSDDYPDALVGTTLAAAKVAPLLFSSGDVISAATQTEIVRILPQGRTVYLLGGTSAIPSSVASTLTSLGYVVVRLGGADRYATALAVAGALGDPTTVVLATGINFPDALAAGPAAAHVNGVVLLTDGTSLPSSISTYLTAHPGKVYAVGGPAVIADPSATSLAGTDRYATAVAVANQFFPDAISVGLASGTAFADALAGGAFLAHSGGPLVLSDPSVLSPETSAYLTAHEASLTTTSIFGGTTALSSNVLAEVEVALGQ